MTKGYHWREGLYFNRAENGDVEIRKMDSDPSQAFPSINITIPANEWASIVSFVSKGGETGESYSGTFAFHMGSLPYPSPGRLVPPHGSGP
jgi:hypothetical protein